jgi:hypothetical protein
MTVVTRVLLDTSTVRAWLEGASEAEPLACLEGHLRELSVALANNAIPELALALHEGRIPWTTWILRAPLLGRILDVTSPVFPDDQELLHTAIEETPPCPAAISRREHFRAIWRTMSSARCHADLTSSPAFLGSDGAMYRIQSSRALVEQLTEQHRERWRSPIRELRTRGDVRHPTQEQIAELLFVAYFGGRSNEPEMRMRHDGFVRSLARFMALALQRGSRYNPDAKSRRGDSFDVELLRALALPALICTLDARLMKHMAATGSPQVSQLLTPRQLHQEVECGVVSDRLPG